MKAFFQTVFGIFATTAAIMATIIYFFSGNTAAYTPVERDHPQIETSPIVVTDMEQEEAPTVSSRSQDAVSGILRDTTSSLYEKLSSRTLFSGSYSGRETEFASLLRAQLATILNLEKVNCFVTVADSIIYVDLEYKDRDNAYVAKDGLSNDPLVKENLKDILQYISYDAKRAANNKDLFNTHVAVAYVDTMDDRALLITLNDKVFFDFYDSYQSPPDLTLSQLRAIADATQRLSLSPYSKDALIDRLKNKDGFSDDDTLFAIDYIERHNYVDWVGQAIRAASIYLEANPFSKEKLTRQLASETGERFPRWDANKAIEIIEDAGAGDWNYQALRAAMRYSEVLPYSQNEYMEHLTSEDGAFFTWEQALYAVEYVNEHGLPDLLSDLKNVKLYHSGLYKIGEDLEEGEYILFSTDEVNGFFSVASDLAGEETFISDRFAYNSIIQVNKGEYLDIRHAVAVSLKDFYCSCHSLNLGRDHLMVKVGYELSPRKYKLQATDGRGTYTVYDDSRQTVYSSDMEFSGIAYVVLKCGQCVKMDGCRIVFD